MHSQITSYHHFFKETYVGQKLVMEGVEAANIFQLDLLKSCLSGRTKSSISPLLRYNEAREMDGIRNHI